MIGIVSAAFALPEGITRLISVCIRYIIPTEATLPKPSMPCAN